MPTDPLLKEKRNNTRYEPVAVNASLMGPSKIEISGILLDISYSGLAIDFPRDTILPNEGSNVEVRIMSKEPSNKNIHLGAASVKRVWEESTYYDSGKGISLAFDKHITDPDIHQLFLRGTQQYKRRIRQHDMATYDINHLSSYRCSLSECQVKLFTQTITLSVMIATVYFALIYYGLVTGKYNDVTISFWRTLLASLPGLIAVIFGLLVSQKNASIQRVDAFLAVIKECFIKNRLPREYRGWETESYKFRHVMNTKNCNDCEIERKCGEFTKELKQAHRSKKILKNPKVDTYYLIMYSTFYGILILSTLALFIELTKYKYEFNTYVIIISSIAVFMFVALAAIVYETIRLRIGSLSFVYYKQCWIDLLGRCRKSVHI